MLHSATLADLKHTYVGEHIDYSQFGVFPAAIEPDILMSCSPRRPGSSAPSSDLIVAENMDDKYEMKSFSPVRKEDGTWKLAVDKKSGGWANFLKVT